MKKERKSRKQIKFQETIRNGILELGATETKGIYKYSLETPLGELLITMHAEDLTYRTSTIYSVYTRFKEPERAKQKLDCNPFSGKWNFHEFMDDGEPVELAEKILQSIKEITGVNNVRTYR